MRQSIRQIIIEGLRWRPRLSRKMDFSGPGLDWRLKAGSVAGVFGGHAKQRRSLLRAIAGLDCPAAGKITYHSNDKTSLVWPPGRVRNTAYMPPPGEEVFTGTTVGEELEFYSKTRGKTRGNISKKLEQIGLFDFMPLWARSVWELSDGEKRLLLFTSLALARPAVWVCDEPYAMLDGKSLKKVCRLLRNEAARGAVVVLASEKDSSIMNLVENMLFLSADGKPLFKGSVSSLPAELSARSGWKPELWNAAARARNRVHLEELLKSLIKKGVD